MANYLRSVRINIGWRSKSLLPPRPVLLSSINRRLFHENISQHEANRTAVRGSILAESLPTINKSDQQITASLIRTFSSFSPTPQAPMEEEPEDWDAMSGARKLQEELQGTENKWGFAVFRTTYKPGLDRHWEAFKAALDAHTRVNVAVSDVPEMADKLEWVFIEDTTLESASRDALRQRFRQWCRNEDPQIPPDYPQPHYITQHLIGPSDGSFVCPSKRHSFFFEVDEESLRSLLVGSDTMVRAQADYGNYAPPNEDRPVLNPRDLDTVVRFRNGGWLNLVGGWYEPDPEYEASLLEEEKTDDLWTESWFRVSAEYASDADFHSRLGEAANDKHWHLLYVRPPCVLNHN